MQNKGTLNVVETFQPQGGNGQLLKIIQYSKGMEKSRVIYQKSLIDSVHMSVDYFFFFVSFDVRIKSRFGFREIRFRVNYGPSNDSEVLKNCDLTEIMGIGELILRTDLSTLIRTENVLDERLTVIETKTPEKVNLL